MNQPVPDPRSTGHDVPADLSTVQLIDRLGAQVSTLVRTEIAHGLAEVKSKGTRLGIGVGISGAGVLLLLYGFGALIATAILGLATALEPWLAALIVAVVVLAVGGVLAAVGAKRAKQAVPPVPQDTAESVRDDVAVVKESMK
ncbi:phage holin family protein [Aldersonia sp. NBC_00410]|uniref:phage holin family protein n=1 Tax=Aldersonia sp. NBC_00410 TaxID=2975954 RepID=UPI00225A70E5|nr:phage holin family protein [Aldersonia sp. NBC_00410]MCX5044134.1 phage holin family protein [Aldersonia sp. NBC_00410]